MKFLYWLSLSSYISLATAAFIYLIEEIPLKLPPIEIQEKIVNILSQIDKKIEIENKYLQSLLAQKSYLLSNMFI